jgi:hypothetical protein
MTNPPNTNLYIDSINELIELHHEMIEKSYLHYNEEQNKEMTQSQKNKITSHINSLKQTLNFYRNKELILSNTSNIYVIKVRRVVSDLLILITSFSKLIDG